MAVDVAESGLPGTIRSTNELQKWLESLSQETNSGDNE